MREMVFRNLKSGGRRIIATTETGEREGVHSSIRRHFIYIVKEVADTYRQPEPSVHILKEHNSRRQIERFCCRLKNSVYAKYNGKLYLILFMHSLSITLTAATEGLAQCN
ncbi:MAG: hypothetical protein WC469_04755 [Candidatus Omnitrophota bacterium]|jgi:hypothetical protein